MAKIFLHSHTKLSEMCPQTFRRFRSTFIYCTRHAYIQNRSATLYLKLTIRIYNEIEEVDTTSISLDGIIAQYSTETMIIYGHQCHFSMPIGRHKKTTLKRSFLLHCSVQEYPKVHSRTVVRATIWPLWSHFPVVQGTGDLYSLMGVTLYFPAFHIRIYGSECGSLP